MILKVSGWPIFALIGGGVCLYFSSIIVLNRVFLKEHSRKVGKASSEYGAYIFGCIWIISAIAIITLAIQEISAQPSSFFDCLTKSSFFLFRIKHEEEETRYIL